MSSVNYVRTGNDRRLNDSFHSFEVPSGRRWMDRREPVKHDYRTKRLELVAATVVLLVVIFLSWLMLNAPQELPVA
jgi:hypothetical protein